MRYPLQVLKSYPLSKYFIKYETEYFYRNKLSSLYEYEITFRRTYNSDNPKKILTEFIDRLDVPIRDSFGFIIGYFFY
jgi:hypothetical protein